MNTRALAGLAILFCLAAIPAMAETHDFSLARATRVVCCRHQ